jgi:hypothetical protein
MHEALKHETADERTFAIAWYKEAVDDLYALLTARK